MPVTGSAAIEGRGRRHAPPRAVSNRCRDCKAPCGAKLRCRLCNEDHRRSYEREYKRKKARELKEFREWQAAFVARNS